ncbi:MAG: porin [Luteibaculaceae bacterium]
MQIFKFIPAFLFIVLGFSATAQVTITNGKHNMEITGAVSTYWNQRFLKPDATNQSLNKDRFRLRDAQLQIEGRIENKWSYELQVDFVDLASTATGEIDPENPGLMDAYAIYKGIPFFNVRFGYGKLPFSRHSLVPFIYSPYWQRAEFLRGDIFARRDVGVSLEKSFWKQRIFVAAGVYNGIGEISLRGDNDPSGAFEYVGRVEFAYPSRYRYRDIDDRHVPIPMFVIGANGRYTERNLPFGRPFPAFAQGEYGIKVIDGRREVVGFDASFQYKGFSAQIEAHQMRATPQNPNNALLQGLPLEVTEGFFLMGGFMGQASYFSKKLKSMFSVRYETFNLNDLSPGQSERFSCAYAYQIDGWNTMIKAQYFNILAEEAIDPLRWNEQFRVGIQILFK